jgi:TonB-dependent SusC/RagA subfamily outer membrane receptor
MKDSTILILFSFFLICSACTSMEQTSDSEQTVASDDGSATVVSDSRDTYRTLADFLQRVSGVQVTGPSHNPTIKVRGSASFMANTDPLYVIDGNVVGNSYSQANNMLNVRDIDNVRVLMGSDASIYGVRGANGVILITTKR